jgi:hypothetical protein
MASARVERLPNSVINPEKQDIMITALSKYAVAMSQLECGAMYQDAAAIEKAANLTLAAAEKLTEARK